MKPGDIIVCIDINQLPTRTSEIDCLTINKQYKVLEVSSSIEDTEICPPVVVVKCDDNSEQHFSMRRFITLREYNLNKLL